jgi:transposase-like protein
MADESSTPDSEWMQDRPVFVQEKSAGDTHGAICIDESAKRRWDKRNPPRFTPETALEIVQYLCVAATKTDAAEAAGISRNTLNNWIAQAEDLEKTTEELRAFASWCGRARALRRIEALKRIQKQGSGDWKAEAFVLERSDPENWRQRNSSILENPDGTPVAPPRLEVTLFEGSDSTTASETPPK